MTTSTQREAGHRAAAWVFVVLGALLLVLAGAAARADAARLGPLTSTTLLGRSYGYGALTSSFSYPQGTSLAATVTNCAQPWTVVGGGMHMTGNQALVASTTALVTATAPLCLSVGPNAEAGGNLLPSGGASFGVLVNAASGGRPSTAAVYHSDTSTVQLRRISSTGTVTTWAQAVGIPSGNTARHLRMAYVDGVYTVSMNGTVVLTHTIPDPATRTEVETFGAVGVVSFSDTKTTFDNFQGYPR